MLPAAVHAGATMLSGACLFFTGDRGTGAVRAGRRWLAAVSRFDSSL